MVIFIVFGVAVFAILYVAMGVAETKKNNRLVFKQMGCAKSWEKVESALRFWMVIVAFVVVVAAVLEVSHGIN